MAWIEDAPAKCDKSWDQRINNVYFSVVDQDDQRWQYLDIHFGVFTDASAEECLQSWPMEAIRRARAELDKLEAHFQKGTE